MYLRTSELADNLDRASTLRLGMERHVKEHFCRINSRDGVSVGSHGLE